MYTDSTHVKAKGNKYKKQTVTVERTPKAYPEDLDAAVAKEREQVGKKSFDRDSDSYPKQLTTRQKRKSDPDSGQLNRDGKPDGFHYSEHRTVDSQTNIVVNVRITPANINDADPINDILNDMENRLGFLPKYMGVDAGYHTAPACHQIKTQGIQPVVGYCRHTHKGEPLGKYRFRYDPERNVYVCPEHHDLTWRTSNREGFREYPK